MARGHRRQPDVTLSGHAIGDGLRGLRHNVTMTMAMVLTTAISLTLLGAGLIVARMTDQMRDMYSAKVEVTVYLTVTQSQKDPDCGAATCQDLGRKLRGDPDVAAVSYQSQAAAWQQYQKMFAGQPDMLAIADQSALNASFQVKLENPQRYARINARYASAPGVETVTGQSEVLDRMFTLLNGIRNATIAVALVMALATLLLISNMVQVAAFARRTETAVMRLVGASRWRTQVPFVVEAVAAAIIGAAVAIGALATAKKFLIESALGPVMRAGVLPPLDTAALAWVAPWLAGAAVALATVSSYLTLRLYVRL